MPGKPGFDPTEDLETRRDPFHPILNASGFVIQNPANASIRLQMSVCILGTSRLGRSAVGYQPFIVGVDKLGQDTIY